MSEPWIQTYSGLRFNLLEPDESMISIVDIAHALSCIGRYNGHTKEFYSVAEHCVYVAEEVAKTNPEFKFEGLMHDAAEAYIGDLTSPLKSILPDYKVIEKRIERVIARKFGLKFPLPAVVKHADLQLLVDEKHGLHKYPDKHCWEIELSYVPNKGRQFSCYSPAAAETFFLKTFNWMYLERGHA